MPGVDEALAVTDAYRAQLLTLRDDVARAVGRQWSATVTLDNLDAGGRRWLTMATTVVAAGQLEAARMSAAYLAAFLTVELGQPVGTTGLDWRARTGRTTDGRPVGAVLAVSLMTVKQLISRRRPPADALRAGHARALRVAMTEPMESSRAALDEAITTEDRVIGWRRVTSSAPCGACIGAATGAIQETDQLLLAHPRCRCTKEPVVRGVREHVQRPTGQAMWDAMSPGEQDNLFAGTGGKAKADLIRSGDASLADLVDHQHHHEWHDTITERPLAGLLGR